MSGYLDQARERAEQEQEQDGLTVLEEVSIAGKVLAVCKTSSGSLVLTRKRTVGKLGPADAEGKRKRDRKLGTEDVHKRTSEVEDIAHAQDAELL